MEVIRKRPLSLLPRQALFNLRGSGTGEFWGPNTRNGGIPPEYAPSDAPLPTGTRDDGAYLLRHGHYLVDADVDCSVGYANEGWRDANCFFQYDSAQEPVLLLVLKRTLLPYRIYELTVNYGREYWASHPNPRLDLLNAAGLQQFYDYYGGG